jgi:site-specific recombinase XerD
MLPNLALLNQIQQRILSIPNQRKETKRREHYCCYLLCQKAGLRTSEAVNFDLNAKTQQGLYKITKTKGKKTRLAYIPKQVIRELKANN